ncbi:MAG: extracellular solute-binding protein [Xanthobacteraceae bacterium]|jgi:putative spermidine/putrescine transport system substrate-binding protein|nr:extracellular solute-binding protein [Xanthobacteraceae bacterium]
MRADLSRRVILKSAASAALAGIVGAPAIVRAQARELVVGGPLGQAEAIKRAAIPLFEAKHKCKVVYDGSQSFANLQKMQASRDKPIYSVVMMDDPILHIAADQDLLEKLKPSNVPTMGQLSPGAILRDGLWVNYMWPALSIGYNEKQFPKGLASWEEMWDPRHKSRVLIPSYKSTTAPFTTAMAAHLETGEPMEKAQYKVDAAFKKLKALKPNILDLYVQPTQASILVEQGEAGMAAGFYTTYVIPRRVSGIPLGLATPKEGMFAMPKGIAKVKNSPAPELADAFIEECLAPDFQAVWMKEFFSTPTNLKVTATAGIPSASELVAIDWKFASDNLKQLTDRFDREIAS